MNRYFFLLISIGVLNLLVFGCLFSSFQNEKFYRNSIGLISQNYERPQESNQGEIIKSSKPYVELNNENILTWDASIYKCICERMYVAEYDCYGSVRAAFFPLFPIFWKITNCNGIGISLINYFLFIVSVSLLAIHLLKEKIRNNLLPFAILITLPTTIIFFIPYSEALFLFTMTIAAIGIIKEKYRMYFIGILLLAMVRPATIFVLIAILTVEIFIFLRNKDFGQFLKNSLLRGMPFLIGYFISLLVQYLYSGSVHAFPDAHRHWSGQLQGFKSISDWSVEGFGMNSFSIFFISIPALLFSVFLLIKIRDKNFYFLRKPENFNYDYLLLTSVIYLVGIFLFTLITSGGNLHSFFRFTMSTPLFYIGALLSIKYLPLIKTKKFVLGFIFCSILLFLFLGFTSYGGDKIQFAFIGLYLLMISFFYLGIRNTLPDVLDKVLFSILILSNVIWNTYTFNIYLCNGWIFA